MPARKSTTSSIPRSKTREGIQDREVLIELEPLYPFLLREVIQLKTHTNTAFSSQIGLPAEEYSVLVVQHLPQLSPKELQQHIERVERFFSIATLYRVPKR